MRGTWTCHGLVLMMAGAAPAQPPPAPEDIVAVIRPATVMVETDRNYGVRVYGSGFLVSEDGLVVTCASQVRRAQELACYYRNEQRIRAKVVAEDEGIDIAVLKLQAEGVYPTVRLGDSDLDVIEGGRLGLCAYPHPVTFFDLGIGLDSTAAAGHVAAIRLGDQVDNRARNALLELDLAVQNGNSGGPVFSLEDGKVLAVAVARAESGALAGYGIPINQVKALLAGRQLAIKPKPLQVDDELTTLEPGLAENLVTIRDDKEIATAFVRRLSYAGKGEGTELMRFGTSGMRYFELEAAMVQASADFMSAFGYNPSRHPEILVDGADLYIGGLDETVYRFRQRRLSTDREWFTDVDYPIYVRVALDKENVLAGGGRLNLEARRGELDIGTRVLGSMLGGLFGKRKARVQRIFKTEGMIYVMDRDDGRVKAQVETAFPGTPEVRGGIAYVGALGQLMAFEVETGAVKWKIGDPKQELESRTWYNTRLGPDGKLYTLETPVLLGAKPLYKGADQHHFYLQTGQGKKHDDPTSGGRCRLRCRNPEDGKVEWELAVFNPRAYLRPLATSLLLSDDGKVAYCQLGPIVAAVDLAGQKLLWPEAGALDKSLQQLNDIGWKRQQEAEEADGVQEAFTGTSLTSATSQGLTLANGRLYHGSYDLETEGSEKTYVRVVKPDTGEEVGRLPVVGRPTAPLVQGGVIYLGVSRVREAGRPGRRSGRDPDSWLLAFDESTLEERWRFRVLGNGFSFPPQIVGRSIYFADVNTLYQLPLPTQ